MEQQLTTAEALANIRPTFLRMSTLVSEVLTTFDEDEFNKVPADGGWTAGQVTEHILIAASGALKALHSHTQAADRDPALQVTRLQDLFMDFNIKMEAMPVLRPGPPPHDHLALSDAVRETMNSLRTALQELDLEQVCVDFALPVFGSLTRLEWLYLVSYHTRRHVHQLRELQNETV